MVLLIGRLAQFITNLLIKMKIDRLAGLCGLVDTKTRTYKKFARPLPSTEHRFPKSTFRE